MKKSMNSKDQATQTLRGRQGGSGVQEGAAELSARFEALALPHLESLYRTAMRMTRNCEEAEDLVQETFLKAFRSFRTFRPDANLRAWIFRVLTNSYINRCRKRVARSPRVRFWDAQDTPSQVKVGDSPVHGESCLDPEEYLDGEVKRALEALPAEFRLVIVMALMRDMSYKEIAQALGCPTGTVMSRMHRGRSALRRRLADYARRWGYGC